MTTVAETGAPAPAAEQRRQRIKPAVPSKGQDSILVLYDREDCDENEGAEHLGVRLNGPLARRVIDFIEADEADEWDTDYQDILIISGTYVVDSGQRETALTEGGAE